MTIGIGVSGPNAGFAIYSALQAVEKVATGAIGGFVSLAVIDQDGVVRRAETQRGGSTTLFTSGETTGTPPPPKIASASMAVLMSSGPDRPQPLAQFTPAHSSAGLVSGHRLPNVMAPAGIIPNLAVLERLKAGQSAQMAVEAVLTASPQADAGLIAIDRTGEIHLGNTKFASIRSDLGYAFEQRNNCQVGVLHNAIRPVGGLATLAASIALDAMDEGQHKDFTVSFQGNTRLVEGQQNYACIDQHNRIIEITVAQAGWLGEHFEGAALNQDAAILRGDRLVGHALSEPYCVARDGQVVSMSGASSVLIGVRAVD